MRQKPAAPASARSALAKSAARPAVTLSHLDRVLYPEQGLTKRDLADYYRKVADLMLPHIAERPLSLVRCPAGESGQCFYQKHVGAGTPAALQQIPVTENKGTAIYAGVNDRSGLLALVQLGVLEIHPWGSRADDLEHPDRIIFDLDPDPKVAWPAVIAAAIDIRQRLQAMGLRGFAKLTGGKGIHVVLPVARRLDFAATRAWSKAFVDIMVKDDPDKFTANMAKAARSGRIFIDYLRNSRGATAVAPYSTRARASAPIAIPVDWDELKSGLKADDFTVATIDDRLRPGFRDPWAELPRIRQSITAKARQAVGLKS